MVEWSELDTPIAVTTVVRPEWIEAIVVDPAVVQCSIAEAVARYAALP